MSDKRNPTASRAPAQDVPPELLLKMFNSVPEGNFAVDTDYRITAINDAALSALGLPQRLIAGGAAVQVSGKKAGQHGRNPGWW